jgi:hypothetical protein
MMGDSIHPRLTKHYINIINKSENTDMAIYSVQLHYWLMCLMSLLLNVDKDVLLGILSGKLFQAAGARKLKRLATAREGGLCCCSLTPYPRVQARDIDSPMSSVAQPVSP